MKVIILAGGYATRLRPLTLNQSKPLLKVGKKPMIEWIIDKINEIPDVEEILIITNNKFYKDYEIWKNSSNANVTIINDGSNSDEDKVGRLGDTILGFEKADCDNVLLVYGDNLFRFDLNKLVNLSKEKGSPAVGAFELKDIDEARKMGIFEINENNKSVSFEEKPENPKSMLASTGCYMLTRKALDLAINYKNSEEYDKEFPIVTLLREKMDVYVYPFREEWIDIGSKEQYDKVNKEYS